MKRVAWLLVVVIMCTLPDSTLADWRSPSNNAEHRSSCVLPLSDDDASTYRHVQCIAGIALNVSPSSMRVQSAHGLQRRVRFTEMTRFETDSGEGVLDGLVSGDYVCVAYTPRAGPMTALLVAFDPNSIPCNSRRHLLLDADSP
jgi:hypothetical protein